MPSNSVTVDKDPAAANRHRRTFKLASKISATLPNSMADALLGDM